MRADPLAGVKANGDQATSRLSSQSATLSGSKPNENALGRLCLRIADRTRAAAWKASWDKGYLALQKYRQKHGTADMPVAYVTPDGSRLGKWCRNQRTYRTTKERIRLLNKLGFSWAFRDSRNRKAHMNKRTLVARLVISKHLSMYKNLQKRKVA
jgi:Helicase associated domain